MASITELMIQTSAFSKQLFEQIESIPEEARLFNPTIVTLAREGTELHHRISDWYDDVSLRSDVVDPFTQLALANHHAVRLFHCKNFTYYTCWQAGTIPQLNQLEIDAYVAAIAYLCDQILKTSNIPGAILLFPLRMAGAHSETEWQRDKVRNLLNRVYNSGFVVAERIQTDLSEFWQYKDEEVGVKLLLN
ncbi:hypothetical protein TrVFT333_006535 [Trichoderma virens FT-333]|nr:hypothetical protein TrVFT333_006535 [Trichoderma virens FT-333]